MTTPATLLLDASVWCAAGDRDDPHHAAADDLLRARAVVTLDLTLYEVSNVAVCSWRSSEGASGMIDLVLRTSAQSPIPVTEARLDAAVQLAERYGISVYDAAYAAVAGELAVQLVSCDVRDLVGNGLAMLPEDV